MPRRHELTDPQYERLVPLLPANGRRGGQWNDHRKVLDGMLWRLQTGAPWRDLPERYGPWQTVYDRFNRWSNDGTLWGIVEVLLVELDNAQAIDWDLWCIDGSSIRASRAAGGAAESSLKKRKTSRRITPWATAVAALVPSCI
jgi:transposase